jgi:hypothetical protein
MFKVYLVSFFLHINSKLFNYAHLFTFGDTVEMITCLFAYFEESILNIASSLADFLYFLLPKNFSAIESTDGIIRLTRFFLLFLIAVLSKLLIIFVNAGHELAYA